MGLFASCKLRLIYIYPRSYLFFNFRGMIAIFFHFFYYHIEDRTFQCQVQHSYKCRKKLHREFYTHIPVSSAHSSVKCNTVTNVGKKLHREFYSLVFCAVVHSHRSPKAPFDTQSVTALASSSFGAKRPEIHFCRETWAKDYIRPESESSFSNSRDRRYSLPMEKE